jgi:threonine/homoserine/homoserine lactone efflux protein
MLIYLLFGLTYGFSCAIMPGPLTTFLVSRTLEHGWRRTLPAIFAPVLSDGPILLLVLLVLTRVPPRFEQGLRIAGGLFLLYLAAGAWRAWRHFGLRRPPPEHSGRQSVLSAAAVNLLNPNPYLGWSLVMGPLLLKGWREAPVHGVALLASFYATMVITLAGIVLLFHAAGRIGAKVNRALIGLSAIALAGFAAYQLWLGVVAL